MNSPSKFTVVSLFSGCGGSSLGYQMAGGRVLLAVEWDNAAVKTYRANFPGTPIYHGDIRDLPVNECLQLSGLLSGDLDILDGSPPCQGFSIAGQRRFDDSRNRLFVEYVRLLRGLMPKAFIMENVKGLVIGKMKVVFAEILQALKAAGYCVRVRLLNTKWYGVPQSRPRLIFIGIRNDLEIDPTFPPPMGRPKTVREVLFGLNEHFYDGPPLTPLYHEYWKAALSNPRRIVGWWQSGDVRLKWTQVCNTMTSQSGHGRCLHPSQCRPLSTPERRRFFGFPDSFWFESWRDGIQLMGNCVCPPFMQAMATHVNGLLNTVQREIAA